MVNHAYVDLKTFASLVLLCKIFPPPYKILQETLWYVIHEYTEHSSKHVVMGSPTKYMSLGNITAHGQCLSKYH